MASLLTFFLTISTAKKRTNTKKGRNTRLLSLKFPVGGNFSEFFPLVID